MIDREDMMEYRDELRERAQEIRERFADNVEPDIVVNAAGLTLVSAGVAVGVTLWARGRHNIWALLLPVGLLISGLSLLGNRAWHRRGVRIDEAEQLIAEQLSSLGPIARMRVMRDMAGEAIPFVTSHN